MGLGFKIHRLSARGGFIDPQIQYKRSLQIPNSVEEVVLETLKLGKLGGLEIS